MNQPDPMPENLILFVVEAAEAAAEKAFLLKFGATAKPPAHDTFKASMMAEISRRIRARAVKIEDDWNHFTRE